MVLGKSKCFQGPMQRKYTCMLLWCCVFAQVRRVFNIHLSCILLVFVHTRSLIYGYLTPIPDIFKIRFHCLCILIAPGWSNPRILKEINFHFEGFYHRTSKYLVALTAGKLGFSLMTFWLTPQRETTFAEYGLNYIPILLLYLWGLL